MSGHNLKVGDELAFVNSNTISIIPIERITATGRIKCGTYELNPDLSIRGRRQRWGPYRGEIVTDKHREEMALVQLAAQSYSWERADKRKVPKEHRQRVWEAINAALKAMKESGQ